MRTGFGYPEVCPNPCNQYRTKFLSAEDGYLDLLITVMRFEPNRPII